MLDRKIAACLEGDKGYQAIQAIPGVGPVPAIVFLAEIGDLSFLKERPKSRGASSKSSHACPRRALFAAVVPP